MAHLAPTCPSKWLRRNTKLRPGGHYPGGPLQPRMALEEEVAGRPLPPPRPGMTLPPCRSQRTTYEA